ncbi:Endonuclease III-like protein [Cladobotryum mycophilum]|uniref:Endonuclease III homolog n=1 Tax=Cladobotryum mycophilum TaxID=491253 RepID=A0ABR0S5W7_9HYPO
MRPSRISRDTAKLFERAAGSTSPPPRRTTRSLAAKFAFAGGATNGSKKTSSQTPDIEDSVSPPPRSARRNRWDCVPSGQDQDEGDDDDDAACSQTCAKDGRCRDWRDERVAAIGLGGNVRAREEDARAGGAAYGAAVDTMGCERLADRSASPKDQRFHALIALMLSSQTKDTVNAVVMKRLQTELPAYKPGAPVGLNLDNVLAVEPDMLNQMIWAVGFHNNKTKYIKQAAEILRDKWNGDIPDTIPGLTSLPGVGPKMAYLCLSVAWNRTEGIGVDVHVHRITNLWGWNKTKNPEETRLALQSWLPPDRWREINGLLVGLGQAVCLPVGRRCGECELGLRGLCRAAERKKMEMIKTEEDDASVPTTTVKVEAAAAAAPASAPASAPAVVVVKEEYTVKQEQDDDDYYNTNKVALHETAVSTAAPADPNSLTPSHFSQPGRRKRTRASAT